MQTLATQAEHLKAARVTQLVCAAINLDAAARALRDERAFTGNAKRRLNLLTNASDAFVAVAIQDFDFRDGNGINLLSDVLVEVNTLLLQCTGAQIQACLEQLHDFLARNRAAG